MLSMLLFIFKAKWFCIHDTSVMYEEEEEEEKEEEEEEEEEVFSSSSKLSGMFL